MPDQVIDEATFRSLAERHRRELHIHCYRMLGSFDEAEDLVQETYLRASRGRERFVISLLAAPGEWRLVLTRANRMPAAASHLRARDDTEFRAFKLDLIRLEGGLVAELTTFDDKLFPALGLPEVLHA